MPEILLFAGLTADGLFVVVVRLVAAWLLGWAVALVYRKTRPASAVLESFPGTLVLLSVLIAMVTQVIGDNVARAFSLVGALSIVRFRTVVRDTQDTAYVIFAVAVGMAAGAGYLAVALVGLGVVAAAALFMPKGPAPVASRVRSVIEVRTALAVDEATHVRPTVERFCEDARLQSLGTARQGLSLEMAYDGRLRPGADVAEMVKTLNRLEGVESVSLRTLSASEE